jgi:hypothetical protein
MSRLDLELQSHARTLLSARITYTFFACHCWFFDVVLKVRTLLETILALTVASVYPAVAQTATAVEYYYPAWDAYFVTSFPDEAHLLDSNAFGGVWKRTGKTFEVWTDSTGGGIPVNPTCRFFSTSFAPHSTHFYTPIADECAIAKNSPDWQFEADAFYLGLPDMAGNCAVGGIPLYRLYNNGQGGFPNHRYTNDVSVLDQMRAAGWTAEGNGVTSVFACVPAKVLSIVIVPLRYQSPPSTYQPEVDAYNASLPDVTQSKLQAMSVSISAWWLKVSYGTQAMRFVVVPDVTLPGNPVCNWGTVVTDATKAASAAGYLNFDAIAGVAPYSCWKSKGSTGANMIAIWNTVSSGGPAMFAHEIGHAIGMLHNASMVSGSYVEYGSGVDQMGAGGDPVTLRSLNADHKQRMGIIKTTLPCKSATLRSILDYPDAIECPVSGAGSWFIAYGADYRKYVSVSRREYISGTRGGSDTTDYAWLAPGQSYNISTGQTVTHVGGGSVTITP